MPARYIDLASHWHIAAPADQVWSALTSPADWPRWWPQIRSSHSLRPGGLDGLGAVNRIEWSTDLHLPLRIDVEVIETLRFERLRGRTLGHPRAESIWLLRTEGGITNITHVWRLEFTNTWTRWLAPIFAPALRWSHNRVMRSGASGLSRHLAVRGT